MNIADSSVLCLLSAQNIRSLVLFPIDAMCVVETDGNLSVIIVQQTWGY